MTGKSEEKEQDSVVPPVSFKQRKRKVAHRRRKKQFAAISEIPNAQERTTLRELLVARGFQEEAREKRLAVGREIATEEDSTEDTTGLGGKFSREKGGAAVEKAMADFVEKGMSDKFGGAGSGSLLTAKGSELRREKTEILDANTARVVEYEIPRRLRVEQRKQYDPSEAVPLGIEEVDLE
eukprot:Plantae.Rhodophyta-Hildenbrandia_rubra.ctg5561.p2 GENE.Plantae.Rhodophyta-Hildenbrandia_rubra.ctg5561~~Plantae.Rhodophyta-Hildenbrandia_rubra.ctg5561.p2  ORF type:complete len:181 (+),score=43.83 Plantae.Rhodophyta-Hildenbrandia_rubra.ctg5561:1283-1825(+)